MPTKLFMILLLATMSLFAESPFANIPAFQGLGVGVIDDNKGSKWFGSASYQPTEAGFEVLVRGWNGPIIEELPFGLRNVVISVDDPADTPSLISVTFYEWGYVQIYPQSLDVQAILKANTGRQTEPQFVEVSRTPHGVLVKVDSVVQ